MIVVLLLYNEFDTFTYTILNLLVGGVTTTAHHTGERQVLATSDINYPGTGLVEKCFQCRGSIHSAICTTGGGGTLRNNYTVGIRNTRLSRQGPTQVPRIYHTNTVNNTICHGIRANTLNNPICHGHWICTNT